MLSLFGLINTFISSIVGWISQFATLIVAEPLLLFFVGLSLVGIAVGFITRLIHARG